MTRACVLALVLSSLSGRDVAGSRQASAFIFAPPALDPAGLPFENHRYRRWNRPQHRSTFVQSWEATRRDGPTRPRSFTVNSGTEGRVEEMSARSNGGVGGDAGLSWGDSSSATTTTKAAESVVSTVPARDLAGGGGDDVVGGVASKLAPPERLEIKEQSGVAPAKTPPGEAATEEEEKGGRDAGGGEPGQTVAESPAPSEANSREDGFGEHGWYSPGGATEDGVGSVFSWSGGSPETSRATEAKVSGAVLEAAGQGSQPEGSAEKEHDITRDWSERRRLVETWEEHDEVWLSMRKEAKAAAEKEPLLVSFIYSTILNQKSLEAAVAFHLANKLAGPNMLSTQVQALVRECFSEVGAEFRRQLRRDIIAVRERDPACDSYHDCLLYFKGFQALQTHRVAHWLYKSGRHALAFYLQSQVNQEFQIDIHPGARFGEGVFIDHGTGIVVGETTVVGNDVSMLHRVTLGGSGVQNADRHPKIGNGVLIGAGACLLGNITIGKGTQIGAGSLVVVDLPERCVAVGVPAKVIGQGRKSNPALAMGQDFFKEVWKGLDI